MPVIMKPTLKLGDEGLSVKSLQAILNTLGYLREEYITSVFDFRTEHAVKTLQSNYNLRIDGIVGEKTWNVLNIATGVQPPEGKTLWDWIVEHKVLSFLMLGGIGVAIYLGVKK